MTWCLVSETQSCATVLLAYLRWEMVRAAAVGWCVVFEVDDATFIERLMVGEGYAAHKLVHVYIEGVQPLFKTGLLAFRLAALN